MSEKHLALFRSLNQCSSTARTSINIPKNVTIDQPIVILYDNNDSSPENYISIGKNSKAQLIELYLNNTTTKLTNNAKTTINLDDNACLTHTILQQSTNYDTQFTKIYATQKTNSQLHTQILLHGGNSNNISLHVLLAGSNAICNINALEYTKQQETQALDIQVEHKHANSTSNTAIKSVLDNSSHCLMNGKILVAKNANLVKADLQHKTMLLAEHAKIDSKPQLEIYNDDVACSHGSSIGKLDFNALLYMNTRGISTIEAKQLLLQSFIAPVINAIPHAAIQQYMYQLIFPGENLCSI